MLTVGAPAALASLALNTSAVVGGRPAIGTATLTAPAPAGGAVVLLATGDPATVPASVTVPEGSVTATFSISTRWLAARCRPPSPPHTAECRRR